MSSGLEDLASPPKSRIPGRFRLSTLIWLALSVAAAATVVTNLGELRTILRIVRHSRLEYLAATLVIQALFILNMAYFYANTFRATGLRAKPLRFLLLTSASYFINLVSHTTGLAGLGIYLREARRNGDPAARVSAAYLIVYALGYAAFFLVLAFALVLVYLRGTLTPAETVASAVVVSFFAVIAAIIAVGLRSKEALARSLAFLTAPVNLVARRLLHRPLLGPEAIDETANGLYVAVADMKRRPQAFALPFGHALGVELLSAVNLFLVAKALHAGIGFEVALVGYAFSLLFSLVSITPAGLGFVEASLAVLLISFGVPEASAIATALVFRLFDFWLPVGVGALSLVALNRTREAVPA